MSRAIHRTANWCLGATVWGCAAFVFPWQLGWAGASATALLVYVAIAWALLLAADILHDPLSYRGPGAVRAQAGLFRVVFRLGVDEFIEPRDVLLRRHAPEACR